jgi:hypothetical protein
MGSVTAGGQEDRLYSFETEVLREGTLRNRATVTQGKNRTSEMMTVLA